MLVGLLHDIPVVCVTVMVGVGDGILLVGSGVATSVGVRSSVGSTVLMLLVVLGPVGVYNIHVEQHIYKVCYP